MIADEDRLMCAWMNSSSESLAVSSSLLNCERKENVVDKAGGDAREEAEVRERERDVMEVPREVGSAELLGVRANFILERSSRWAACGSGADEDAAIDRAWLPALLMRNIDFSETAELISYERRKT